MLIFAFYKLNLIEIDILERPAAVLYINILSKCDLSEASLKM